MVAPSGRVLGSCEVRVGKDKVDMERLMVRVISGMNLRITEDRNLPGALMATVYLRDQLIRKQQVLKRDFFYHMLLVWACLRFNVVTFANIDPMRIFKFFGVILTQSTELSYI